MYKQLFIFFLLGFIFTAAYAAPSVTSDTMPDSDEWYSPSTMRFAWDEGQTGNQYSYVIDQEPNTDPGDVSNTSENSLSKPPQLDGVWYFHIKQIPPNGTTHFKFQIDRTAPRTVTGTKAEWKDDSKGIEVNWNESEDLLSGLIGYKIYRQHNESDFDIRYAKVVADDHQSTTYLDVDENFVEGFTYFYKIVAKDLAGNTGPTSLFGFAAIPRKCDSDITIVPSFDGTTRILTIEVTAEIETITNANLRLIPPNSTTPIDIVVDEDDTSGFTGTLDLTDYDDGDSNIMLTAVDDGYDSCNKSMPFPIDSTKPTISWNTPSENSILDNNVTLSVTSIDTGTFQTDIQKVEFFYKEEKIKLGDGTFGTNNTYTYDWDSTTADNGRFPLYAVAKDLGGNTAEASILISLNNKIVARKAANELLDSTREVKSQVQDLNILLLEKNVSIESFYEKVELADGNLSIAESSFERQQYDSSQRYSQIAKDTYQSILDTIKFSPYNEAEYRFISSNLDSMLDDIGFSQHLREEAGELINNQKIQRKLLIEKIQTDTNTEYYIANIVIQFTNLDQNYLSVQVLEVIPKDIMEDAGSLSSTSEFDLVRQDPIVRFLFIDVPKGETKSASYVIYPSLSKDEADLLMKDEIIFLYKTPPIVLSSTTPTSASDFSFALPGFDLGNNLLLVIGIIGIIVLVGIIIILFLYIRSKSKKPGISTGFGGMPAARKGSSKGFIEKIKKKLTRDSKQKTLQDIFK